MRPVDVMVIGLLFGAMGRLEQIRDGRDKLGPRISNAAGFFIFTGGWVWFLLGVFE